jgi:hypothetical protein
VAGRYLLFSHRHFFGVQGNDDPLQRIIFTFIFTLIAERHDDSSPAKAWTPLAVCWWRKECYC